MCPTMMNKENDGFTVKELKQYLAEKNDDLPVHVEVVREINNGKWGSIIKGLEAMTESSKGIILTCFDIES